VWWGGEAEEQVVHPDRGGQVLEAAGDVLADRVHDGIQWGAGGLEAEVRGSEAEDVAVDAEAGE
jgi:hypothetical protein